MKKLIAIVLAVSFFFVIVGPQMIGDDEDSYRNTMGKIFQEGIKSRSQTP